MISWRTSQSAWSSGVARAPQARDRGGPAGLKGLARGPPGRSSRRYPLARGPNKLFAGGPKIVATLLAWSLEGQECVISWKDKSAWSLEGQECMISWRTRVHNLSNDKSAWSLEGQECVISWKDKSAWSLEGQECIISRMTRAHDLLKDKSAWSLKLKDISA